MATPRSPVQEIVGSLVGRLKYPWVFVLLAAVFVADTVIPDPIPFVDEIMLALLTFLVGTWRTRKKDSPGRRGDPLRPRRAIGLARHAQVARLGRP
jgi:hypothetical protein